MEQSARAAKCFSRAADGPLLRRQSARGATAPALPRSCITYCTFRAGCSIQRSTSHAFPRRTSATFLRGSPTASLPPGPSPARVGRMAYFSTAMHARVKLASCAGQQWRSAAARCSFDNCAGASHHATHPPPIVAAAAPASAAKSPKKPPSTPQQIAPKHVCRRGFPHQHSAALLAGEEGRQRQEGAALPIWNARRAGVADTQQGAGAAKVEQPEKAGPAQCRATVTSRCR